MMVVVDGGGDGNTDTETIITGRYDSDDDCSDLRTVSVGGGVIFRFSDSVGVIVLSLVSVAVQVLCLGWASVKAMTV